MKTPKRPRDTNQLAKFIVDLATGETTEPVKADDGKDPAAVSLGRRGGLKGGVARAKKLSAIRRKEIAVKAATTRWKAVTADD
ncbi:MAG: histone H1 [Stenotrophobium sp.]